MERSSGGNYFFLTNHLKNFIFILCFVSIKSMSIIPHNDVINEGSGIENDFKISECLESFFGYQNTFLRGVKEENFITYDSNDFDDCVGKCCLEEKFNCTSFSYFSALKVCYVMNLTKYDEHVQLRQSPGWTHYHKIFLVEGTTSFPEVTSLAADNKFSENSTGSFFSLSTSSSEQETENSDQNNGLEAQTIPEKYLKHNLMPTTDYLEMSKMPKNSLESLGNGLLKINNYPESNDANKNDDATTVQYKTEKIEETTAIYNINEEEMKEDKDLNAERMKLATNVKFGCSGKCENGGRCKYPETKIINQTTNDADLCECKPGFSGKFCQTTEDDLEETGLPSHVVVGAVVGFVIFFLLLILLIVFVVYRHKTGKYRVKFSRDKWRKKKSKNQPKRSDSFVSDMRQPPYQEGEQGSNDTLGSRSTASSV